MERERARRGGRECEEVGEIAMYVICPARGRLLTEVTNQERVEIGL